MTLWYIMLPWTHGVYATEPLRSALELERVTFTGGLDFDENGTLYRTIEPGSPQYVGKPNPEIDANWESLLEGMSTVS